MASEIDKSIQPQILVVDDDSIVRGIARESLEAAGFTVSEVESGPEALAAFDSLRPDIILLDVMMPEMDGFETCTRLRKLPGCELIPILIMTALDDIDSINRAYEAGATDFITKPINWIILVQRVRYMTRTLRMMNERKRLESELQQAQKLEAVATLAGGIAHDFNNLLQAIQGFAELLLLKTKKDEFGYEELQDIYAAARRGGELTLQLLTYSRKLDSEKRTIDLNQHIRRLHDMLQRVIPKMVQIELNLENELEKLTADPVQLEQVLMNLAINARDAMPDGGKLIIETAKVTLNDKYCKKHAKVVPGEYVMIRVTDTGCGMDRVTREQIFEPFFSTKAPGKGTGLGLSMVYGIVENHCGTITCESDPGKGSSFRIYLPLGETGSEVMAARTRKKEAALGGEETILVVDDEESICKYCKRSLEREGYKVITAPDGESALKLYYENRQEIDLVLLDVIMPGIGGKKCLLELLEIDPEVKVVIVTGYSPHDQADQYMRLGARGYLRKPYIGRQLLQIVRNALNRK